MAAASTKGAVPPFAELLRRSRFSSYDPAIAQTYSAPPASARRGDYGLKRPVPMTYRDSYISVPTFEHHAHYTNWNNAERQVKFVRRMEELNVCARPFPKTGWYHSLGDAQNQWLIDSEFAPLDPPNSAANAPVPPPVSEGNTDDLRSFGQRGRYQYGFRRPLAGPSAVQVNFESLSPRQFQRYLSQLRKLGPEFRAYLLEQYESRRASKLAAASTEETREKPAQKLPESETKDLDKDEDILFAAAQNPVLKLHRQFLSKHFSKNFANDTSSSSASSKIEAQPHRSAGLSYTHPSDFQSVLTSSPLPGIVLQDHASTISHFMSTRKDHRATRSKPTDYLVLLGDFLAKVSSKQTQTLQPIYYPDTPAGVAQIDHLAPNASSSPTGSKLNMSSSTDLFRVGNFFFKQLPKVVSYKNQNLRPGELLNETIIMADLVNDRPWSKRNLQNPHKPGSPHYITHISTQQSRSPHLSNTYGPSSVPYGSQMEASRGVNQVRNDKAKKQRFFANANEHARKSRMDEMGMGVGVKDDYSAQNNARVASTLSSVILGRDGRNKGVDEDNGDEEL